jgi:hypothetical protein
LEQTIPYITEYDPVFTSDGSLDPLGLYPIADRLATKLVPGVRERMQHPRFLTAMAVGSVICSDFDVEDIASDGVSEPWMVFEWHVVQAFVKTFYTGRTAISGVPGSEKCTTAYLKGLPLNNARYLKVARVFGFHGVYRTLADELNIIDRNYQLGEIGDALVKAWEKEQKLMGFYSMYEGLGRDFRNKIYQAISDGLKEGKVSRGWGWNYFNEIGNRLAYQTGGKKELDIIYDALVDHESPFRAEVINFLQTSEGSNAWLSNKSEKDFHNLLFIGASNELKTHLSAIMHYESFSRLLENAFESCLYAMSQNGNATVGQLATLEPVQIATQNIIMAFEKASQFLEPTGESLHFYENFAPLVDTTNPKDWIHLLFQFHKNNQRRKPPAGKRPWVEKSSGENYLLYSKFQRKKEPIISDEYVSFYRTNALYSFLRDLKKIQHAE